MDLTDLAIWMLVVRTAERVILTLLVITISIVIIVAFWRSVQSIQFNLSHSGADFKGNIFLIMPAFILFALIGFTYVVLSFPVTTNLAAAPSENSSLEEYGLSQQISSYTNVSNLSLKDRELTAKSIRSFINFYLSSQSSIQTDAQRDELRRAHTRLERHLSYIVDNILGEGSYLIYKQISLEIDGNLELLTRYNKTQKDIYKKVELLFASVE